MAKLTGFPQAAALPDPEKRAIITRENNQRAHDAAADIPRHMATLASSTRRISGISSVPLCSATYFVTVGLRPGSISQVRLMMVASIAQVPYPATPTLDNVNGTRSREIGATISFRTIEETAPRTTLK